MPDGKAEPPAEKRLNAAVPLLLACILLPDTPGNEIDEAVVEKLEKGYRGGDPIPPITVYPAGENQWRLLFGQHRYLAALRAGLREILAVCLAAEPPPLEKVALQWKENHGRKVLTPLEMAALILRAMEAEKLNGKQVAKLFGISEALVSKCLQVHRNLHDSLKALVAKLQMAPRAAYAVARLPQSDQCAFWEAHKGLKIEAVEDAVSEKLAHVAGSAPKAKPYTGATPGGLRFTLPADQAADLTRALAEAKKLVAGLNWALSKKLPVTDLEFFFRNNP